MTRCTKSETLLGASKCACIALRPTHLWGSRHLVICDDDRSPVVVWAGHNGSEDVLWRQQTRQLFAHGASCEVTALSPVGIALEADKCAGDPRLPWACRGAPRSCCFQSQPIADCTPPVMHGRKTILCPMLLANPVSRAVARLNPPRTPS